MEAVFAKLNLPAVAQYAAFGLYTAAVVLWIIKKETASWISICAGAVINLAFIIQRGWIAGVFIPNGMFEGVFVTPMLMAAILAVLRFDAEKNMEYLSASVPLAVFSGFSLLYPTGIIPPTPNKLTVWSNIFFLTETAGHACFYIGGWLAAAGLIRKDESGRYHSLLVWGFVLYSLSQVTGAVWAFLGWGSVFRWGSRHLQSAVIWCFFAAYLHLRFMPGWSRTRRMAFAAAGIAVTALCSFGSYLHEMGFPRLGGWQ
jgi:ABC-type transport system involved in cytochrome c biogenesis permease subunit